MGPIVISDPVDVATCTTTSQSNYLEQLKLGTVNTKLSLKKKKAYDDVSLFKLLIVPWFFFLEATHDNP